MPKSIPSVGDANWGQPLNDHLAQLNDPSTGGINIWDDAASRPWGDGDTTRNDLVGKTGYNRETGSFERWEVSPSPRWVALQKAVSPSAYRGPGQIWFRYDFDNGYFYLETQGVGPAEGIGELTETGNIVRLGPESPIQRWDFLVEEVINGNKVRVQRINYTFARVGNPPTYRTEEGGPTLDLVSQDNFFRVGDIFKGGNLNQSGEPILDSGGTILRKISPTKYINSGNSFNTATRTVFLISRAPQVDSNHSYDIYEPTIKYTDNDNLGVFTIDNAGTTRITDLQARSFDEGFNETNSPMVASRAIAMTDSLSAPGAGMSLSSAFALRTGDSYTNLTGVIINNFRALGSDINSSASGNVNDWLGANTGNPAALTVSGGFSSRNFGTLNNPVVVQDAYNSIIIRPSYKSGKIRFFTHLRFWVVAASGGDTTPMDELWGIYETGSTAGMSGGDKECKNYFMGNTAIGAENGASTGGSGVTYNNLVDKLTVYGSLAVKTAGSKIGNVTAQNNITATKDVVANQDVAAIRNVNAGANVTATNNLTAGNNVNYGGSLNNTSDRRLKENITPLVSSEVLAKIQELQGHEYNLKADQEKKTRFGFVAQELEKVFPELVSTREEDEMKQVNYIDLVPVLTEALKAQQTRIEALEKRLSDLES